MEALRDGLAEPLAAPIDEIHVERQIVRRYSKVLFCQVVLESGARVRCVAKVVTGPSDSLARRQVLMARDFHVNRHLHATLSPPAEVAVPTPLLFRPELNLIVTEFMPGQRLQERLVRVGRGWPTARALDALEQDCAACGNWLNKFQTATADLVAGEGFGSALDVVDAGTFVEQVALCLQLMRQCAASPFTDGESSEVVRYTERRVAQIGPLDNRTVGVHGDFFAGNVLRDGQRTIGIDFVMFRKGSPLVDLSYFVLQLETLRMVPAMRAPTVRRLIRAVLHGYDPAIDSEGFWVSSPAAQALYVLHAVRRLWGMAGHRAPAPRALVRRMQAAWTARRLLGHVRGQVRAREA